MTTFLLREQKENATTKNIEKNLTVCVKVLLTVEPKRYSSRISSISRRKSSKWMRVRCWWYTHRAAFAPQAVWQYCQQLNFDLSNFAFVVMERTKHKAHMHICTCNCLTNSRYILYISPYISTKIQFVQFITFTQRKSALYRALSLLARRKTRARSRIIVARHCLPFAHMSLMLPAACQ